MTSATSTPPVLRGPRLTLVAATLVHLEAELAGGSAALATLLGAAVPGSWPPGEYDRDALEFFHARLLAGGPSVIGWYGWYAVVHLGTPEAALVGAGGFFGPPDADGVVEIGYSVAPEYQRQGYATELVQALVAHAERHPSVRTVRAHTTRDNVASVRVLQRAGFVEAGADHTGGQVRYLYTPASR